MVEQIGGAGDRLRWLRIVETIAIAYRQFLQGDAASPQIERGHAPVVFVFAPPGVARQREGQDGFRLVLPFEYDIVFFDEDLFVIDAVTDKDMTRGGRIGRQTVEGLLDGRKIAPTGRIDDDGLL